MAASNTGFRFSAVVLLPKTVSPPNAPAPQAQVPNAIFAIVSSFYKFVTGCKVTLEIRFSA
jgi:hypothetical protein